MNADSDIYFTHANTSSSVFSFFFLCMCKMWRSCLCCDCASVLWCKMLSHSLVSAIFHILAIQDGANEI